MANKFQQYIPCYDYNNIDIDGLSALLSYRPLLSQTEIGVIVQFCVPELKLHLKDSEVSWIINREY